MEWNATTVPGLIPIENLSSPLNSKVQRRPFKPKNVAELMEFLKQEWELNGSHLTSKLFNSMSKRIEEIIRTQGCHIKILLKNYQYFWHECFQTSLIRHTFISTSC